MSDVNHSRLKERAELKRKLENGTSIHMPAPRRIGKTWTVERLAHDLRGAGWHTVELDVEVCSTAKDFARLLCKKIEAQSSLKEKASNHVRQRLHTLLQGRDWDKPISAAITEIDPTDFAEALVESLDNHEGKKTAIIVDEVAFLFLEMARANPEKAKKFAYWLRALERSYKSVRWVLTGSIGLDAIARQYGLSGAFVDFEIFKIHPFTPQEARSFMRAKAITQNFTCPFYASDAALDFMFDEIGWLSPFYLKEVANAVEPGPAAEDAALPIVEPNDIECAIKRLLEPDRKMPLEVWREHVDKNFPEPDRTLGFTVLGKLAQNKAGERMDTLLAMLEGQNNNPGLEQTQSLKKTLSNVLSNLISSGLVHQNSEDRYLFRSGLVRRFWAKYEAE